MRLLLVRHAIAVERGTPEIADDDRGLTRDGQERFESAASGLATLLPRPGLLLSSPLRRARQTARILAVAWKPLVVKLEPVLTDGSAEQVAEMLRPHRERSLVALVGHEGHLSELLAYALDAASPAALAFRKGGAALLDVPERLERGARLVWFLPPKVLRRIGARPR